MMGHHNAEQAAKQSGLAMVGICTMEQYKATGKQKRT